MRGGSREGFTLVEALVALAVVAGVGVALQRGVVSTRLALARAEALTAAEGAAREVLEGRLAELAPEPGERRAEVRGLAVTVVSEPLDLPLPAPRPPDPPQGEGQGQRQGEGGAPEVTGQSPGQARGSGPIGPDAGRPPAETARFVPLRVTIRVEPAFGPPLTIETLHAAPAP